MKRSAIILAGGDISQKFVVLNSMFNSPALIPINSRVLSQYVLEAFFRFDYDNIFLIVDENEVNHVEDEIFETIRKTNTKVYGVKKNESIIDTLLLSLPNLIDLNEIVTVSVVTTVPTADIKLNQILISDKFIKNESWSGFDFENDKVRYVRKVETLNEYCYAFQGTFSILKNTLISSLDKIKSKDLIDLVCFLLDNGWKADFVKTKWIDCGHEANYVNAKNELINSRNFNRLTVKKGIITKKSIHHDKILAEIEYYKNLPSYLDSFFPEILDQDMTGKEAYYTMTYFNFPNLSELSLYWNISSPSYRKIFQNIGQVINLFKKQPSTFTLDQYNDFYINKTIKRVQQYKHSFENLALKEIVFNKELIEINNSKYFNYEILLLKVAERIKIMFSNTIFCFVHGDLCFNNILVNPIDYSIKLIDPRGSFSNGENTIYGDLQYDLAKLAHSSIYHYDHIVSDLFKLEVNDENFCLQFNDRANNSILCDETIRLIKKNGFALNDIKMIVGLLFLSMTPLHSDSESRQLAMYLNGIVILNESLNE